ncbi:GFA family protein [Roseobacter sp. CCS2]|uniref:GFA family protein n=1 Tax=Roseobacter sp. CCS2 TaxID=391593 RepID=UPI0000F40507|nr:hypothetical protein [Roseobacter sp. CCS2]EBA13035.1 hypothetical protein RCCS2_04099 [Roseobacter sp. CCS2]
MIIGTCHCGAVRYAFDHKPKWTTSCNCSICRRLGALWIYAKIPLITVTGQTTGYTRDQKSLAFHHCVICGCTTHWENLAPDSAEPYMAVNLRLAAPDVVASVPVRRFDGAETWAFLD